jgi:DNA repair ATPase RecN
MTTPAEEITLADENSQERLKALAYDRLAVLEQLTNQYNQQADPIKQELAAINARIQQLINQAELQQVETDLANLEKARPVGQVARPKAEHNGRVTTPRAKQTAKRQGAKR